MSITAFLKSNGFHTFEGHCQEVPKQVFDLIRLTKSPVTKIMEIGFSAGHSSEIFLRHNPNVSVVSFDNGSHIYVDAAKQYIDRCYPNRHTLILGNSKDTFSQFADKNPEPFDVIFLDASHDPEVVRSDMENCRKVSTHNTLIVMDDIYWPDSGTSKVWQEYVDQGKIIEMDRKTYQVGRGMTWGKFSLL